MINDHSHGHVEFPLNFNFAFPLRALAAVLCGTEQC